MSSVTQKDRFTEVTRKHKKRTTSGSSMLPGQKKSGSAEPPLRTPVRPKPNFRNKIPVILSAANEEFRNWRKLMGELRQFHLSLKISQIKELPKGSFLIIGDSMQDAIILQSETKMKAALGKNVKVSFPKAFQRSKIKTKSLAIKGVPTDITDSEFIEFLDLNKVTFEG